MTDTAEALLHPEAELVLAKDGPQGLPVQQIETSCCPVI